MVNELGPARRVQFSTRFVNCLYFLFGYTNDTEGGILLTNTDAFRLLLAYLRVESSHAMTYFLLTRKGHRRHESHYGLTRCFWLSGCAGDQPASGAVGKSATDGSPALTTIVRSTLVSRSRLLCSVSQL